MLGRRWPRGTQGRGFPGCPIPALFPGAQCSPWSSAQPHGEAASDGEGVSCGSPFLCSMVVFTAGPPPCTCSGSWGSPGAAAVVSAAALPQTPPVILLPSPLLLLELLWSPLGSAGAVSSMHPASHLSQHQGLEAQAVRGLWYLPGRDQRGSSVLSISFRDRFCYTS